jgi:hypothetical protein
VVLTSRPQAQRSRKGFLHHLLGKIKIAEQADQSCQDSSRIHAGSSRICSVERSDMTTTLANQLPRINLANGGSMESAQAVTLKSGQQNGFLG